MRQPPLNLHHIALTFLMPQRNEVLVLQQFLLLLEELLFHLEQVPIKSFTGDLEVHFDLVLDVLGPLGETQRRDSLTDVPGIRRAGYNQRSLVVPSEGFLEEPGELGVAIRDVIAILSQGMNNIPQVGQR